MSTETTYPTSGTRRLDSAGLLASLNQDGNLIRHFVAFALFAIYGTAVCPYIDKLSIPNLLWPIGLTLAALVAVRPVVMSSLLPALPETQRQYGHFMIDFSLYVGASAMIGLLNYGAYGFPFESALKVTIGFLTFGFIVGADLALNYELRVARDIQAEDRSLTLPKDYVPTAVKLSFFVIACLVMLGAVIYQVVQKDLFWLLYSKPGFAVAKSAILTEIAFVVGVGILGTTKIVTAYARNLSFYLNAENEALRQVMSGNLKTSVPVASNDEFGRMAELTNQMIEELSVKSDEVVLTQDASILGMATLAEARDNETGAHILRTQRYVKLLAQQLQSHPAHSAYLTDDVIDLLYKSAPLHDIGKVGIPDAILLKPGKLTDDEFVIMKTHATIGAEALATAQERLGSTSFLRLAQEIAETHHEKWDGSGYPNQLSGRQIPLSGRLMALADVYDALICKRHYKPAFSHEKSRGIILEGRGTHFDPDVVDAFLALEEGFQQVAREFADQEETTH